MFILTCNSIRAYDNLGGIPEVPVSLRTVESSVWLQSDKQCFVPRTLVAIRLFLSATMDDRLSRRVHPDAPTSLGCTSRCSVDVYNNVYSRTQALGCLSALSDMSNVFHLLSRLLSPSALLLFVFLSFTY